ncbi:MAG: SPFH domain-containing protein [Candidatus Promineifilaceae bacterium]|nr:SPFH domain-containing protein [Candidatus Promineifilaceae bacterium]
MSMLAASSRTRQSRRVSLVAVLLFVMLYWFIAWQLERVNYSQNMPELWLRLVALYPLFDVATPYMALPLEFLSLRVLRHFIPVVAGWWLATRAVNGWLESFLDLPDGDAASLFFRNLRRPASPAGGKIAVRREHLQSDEGQRPMLRVGGPVKVNVAPGDAVVTEQNGRFRRVLGPGSHKLIAYERPVAVLDVRPQERQTESARLVTRDGIELSATVSVTFQISSGAALPSEEILFPFDEEAVRQTAYLQINTADDEIVRWDTLALALTVAALAEIVAEYHLDELIYVDGDDSQGLRVIKGEMEQRARTRLRQLGIELRGSRLGPFELGPEIREQHQSRWRARWENRRRLQEADQQAAALQDEEVARAEAEALLLQAIAEGLRRVRQGGSQAQTRDVVVLRFVETLESLTRDNPPEVSPPADLLPLLDDLRQRLLLEQNSVSEQDGEEGE